MRGIVIGVGIIVLLGVSVHAAEMLTGRIISVNQEDQSLVIELIPPEAPPSSPAPLRTLPPPARQAEDMSDTGLIQVLIPREAAPPRALRGRVIRAWGEYEETSGGFNAQKIDFSACPGHGGDPTGVRRRLGKRHGHGRAGGGRPCDR